MKTEVFTIGLMRLAVILILLGTFGSYSVMLQEVRRERFIKTFQELAEESNRLVEESKSLKAQTEADAIQNAEEADTPGEALGVVTRRRIIRLEQDTTESGKQESESENDRATLIVQLLALFPFLTVCALLLFSRKLARLFIRESPATLDPESAFILISRVWGTSLCLIGAILLLTQTTAAWIVGLFELGWKEMAIFGWIFVLGISLMCLGKPLARILLWRVPR